MRIYSTLFVFIEWFTVGYGVINWYVMPIRWFSSYHTTGLLIGGRSACCCMKWPQDRFDDDYNYPLVENINFKRNMPMPKHMSIPYINSSRSSLAAIRRWFRGRAVPRHSQARGALSSLADKGSCVAYQGGMYHAVIACQSSRLWATKVSSM